MIINDLISSFYLIDPISIKNEAIVLFIICSLICLIANYFYKKYNYSNNTAIYNHPTYQTKTQLLNFSIDCPQLAPDNTVYLTNFQSDGLSVILFQIIYGFLIYFNDPVNLFCLSVAIGQIYDYMDPRSMLPLSILALYCLINHVYGVSKMIRQQFDVNSKWVAKWVRKRGYFNNAELNGVYIEKKIKQKNLKRGDFVKLAEIDEIPADVLLINSSVSVQEIELTGEDIVISKTGVNIDLNNANSNIIINHHKNEGIIIIENCTHTYNSKNIIFRGTKIVDGQAFGVIIETGNDCQINRINNNRQRKQTQIQKIIVQICIFNLYFMLLLASFTGLIIYSKTINENYSYKKLWPIIRKMILLFNTMIPLSLQFFFNAASSILSNRLSKTHNIIINRNGLLSFQVDPHFIVTDKTGTLTTNQMDIASILTTEDGLTILKNIDILPNILACTEIQPHSQTHLLLKNDVLEEKLLSYLFSNTDRVLIENKILNDGSGHIIVENYSKFDRLYYKPFDYLLEVKLAVIKQNSSEQLILHIQGTPESINKYSDGKLEILLKNIENMKTHKNSYKRVIAHACKTITPNELEILKKSPLTILNSFEQVSVYVFYDYIVDQIDQSISHLLKAGKDVSILTGDKMSSAVDIGKTVGIIDPGTQIIIIENLDDIYNNITQSSSNLCYAVNGRLLESILNTNKTSIFASLLSNTNRKIIYRASPSGKQLYVSFLQNWFKKEVMMVGDGSNDVSALIQSDIGVGINKDNNYNVQNVAEIVVNNWNQLPQLLEDFKDKRHIINNVSQWVLMKHMITAFMLLTILLISQFEKIRDPASPILMAIFNGLMFICMCVYCKYTTNYVSGKFIYMIIKGILLGIINTLIVFTFIDLGEINLGIKLLIALQSLELVIQLVYLYRRS